MKDQKESCENKKSIDNLSSKINSLSSSLSGKSSNKNEKKVIKRKRGGEILGRSLDPSKLFIKQNIKIIPKSNEIREKLRESLMSLSFLCKENPKQLDIIIDAMYEQTFSQGIDFIKQGDRGDFCYILEKGIADVYILKGSENVLVHTYFEKGIFGELALLYNKPRAATLRARTECKVWVIGRKIFQSLVLKAAFERRKRIAKTLNGIELMKKLSKDRITQLSDALRYKVYYKGDYVVKQGEVGDSFFMIDSGKVEVFKDIIVDNKTERKILNVLDQGKCFGELALLKKAPRVASIVVISDELSVLTFNKESFERILGPVEIIFDDIIKSYNLDSKN